MHLGKRLIHGAGGQGRSFRLVRNPGGIGHAGIRFHTIPVYSRPGLRHFRFKGADQRLVRLFADGFAKALGGSLFFRAIRNRLLRQRGSLALRRQQRHEGRLFDLFKKIIAVLKRIPRHHPFGLFPGRGFRIGRFGLPRQGLPAIIMKSPAGLRFRRRLGVIDDIKKVYDAFFLVVGIFPRHTGLSSAKNINGYE